MSCAECSSKPQKLCSGIFWILVDGCDLDEFCLLAFKISCDRQGNIMETPAIPLNSKNGKTYNHKRIWEEIVKMDSSLRPYHRHLYDYYPRGRVEIANDRATIYLSPHANTPDIIHDIQRQFGLDERDISEIRVRSDHSIHYRCFLDREM